MVKMIFATVVSSLISTALTAFGKHIWAKLKSSKYFHLNFPLIMYFVDIVLGLFYLLFTVFYDSALWFKVVISIFALIQFGEASFICITMYKFVRKYDETLERVCSRDIPDDTPD